MKDAFEEAAKRRTPPPGSAPTAGIDLNDFMQSPAVKQMAQNLMNNPALVQQMMGAFQQAKPP